MASITDTPRCFAVIGDPISQSLSPRIHNASFHAQKIHAVYLPLWVTPKDLKRLIPALTLMDIEGCNVTTPHKQTIIPLLDRLDESASIAGSVNTVYRWRKRWIGANTDGIGFLQACKERRIRIRGKSICIIGAGGAASAIAAAVLRAGARHIWILNRNVSRTQALVRRLKPLKKKMCIEAAALTPQNCRRFFADTDVFVHATSQGMKASPRLKLPLDALPAHAALCDCQYRAGKVTPLIAWAMRHRRRYSDGQDLLLHQAAASYRIWTGRTPSISAMKRALRGRPNGAKHTRSR